MKPTHLSTIAKGYRTFLVAGVILLLAICQRFLSLQIPQEVWIGLFALLAAALRSAIPPAAAGMLLLALALYTAGCTSVTVNITPPEHLSTQPTYISVSVQQNAQRTVPTSLLTGLDTNAWQAIARGATAL